MKPIHPRYQRGIKIRRVQAGLIHDYLRTAAGTPHAELKPAP
jgi:hypothetical protein